MDDRSERVELSGLKVALMAGQPLQLCVVRQKTRLMACVLVLLLHEGSGPLMGSLGAGQVCGRSSSLHFRLSHGAGSASSLFGSLATSHLAAEVGTSISCSLIKSFVGRQFASSK